MTPIEHYLIKELNLKRDSKLMRELIHYLESKDYGIDFDKINEKKAAVVILKSPIGKCHVWREGKTCALYEEESILDPESYFYGFVSYEQTIIGGDFENMTIVKNFYDKYDDAGIVHQVEYCYQNRTSRAVTTSLNNDKALDLRAINKLHDVLYDNDILLSTANREIMRESNKIFRKAHLQDVQELSK